MSLELTFESIVRKAEERFFAFPGVTKVSIRQRLTVDGTPGQLFLEVELIDATEEQKRLADGLTSVLSISEFDPNTDDSDFGPLPVEFIQTGKIRAIASKPLSEYEEDSPQVAYTGRVRPAAGGDSIGNARFNYCGTLGMLVKSGVRYMILTNWHVLVYTGGARGDAIIQPGRPDGGSAPGDVIGKLIGWRLDDNMDMALAQIEHGEQTVRFGTRDFAIGPLTSPSQNMHVKKSGRTTNLSEGMILSISATVAVEGPWGGNRTFRDQIETSSMLQSGDSGSILCASDSNNSCVGLLFADSENRSYANKLSYIMKLYEQTYEQDTLFCSKDIPKIEFL